MKDNFKAIFDDFDKKIKNIENLRRTMTNKENNLNLNLEIDYKTTENSSVNIYILSQLEELFVYSIIMDVATTIKTKKQEFLYVPHIVLDPLDVLNNQIEIILSRFEEEEFISIELSSLLWFWFAL